MTHPIATSREEIKVFDQMLEQYTAEVDEFADYSRRDNIKNVALQALTFLGSTLAEAAVLIGGIAIYCGVSFCAISLATLVHPVLGVLVAIPLFIGVIPFTIVLLNKVVLPIYEKGLDKIKRLDQKERKSKARQPWKKLFKACEKKDRNAVREQIEIMKAESAPYPSDDFLCSDYNEEAFTTAYHQKEYVFAVMELADATVQIQKLAAEKILNPERDDLNKKIFKARNKFYIELNNSCLYGRKSGLKTPSSENTDEVKNACINLLESACSLEYSTEDFTANLKAFNESLNLLLPESEDTEESKVSEDVA